MILCDLKRNRALARGGDLQKFMGNFNLFPWAKYPGEHHLIGHSFSGPGTNLDKRLDENDQPLPDSQFKNRVDAAAYKHDLAYRSEDLNVRHEADKRMIEELKSIENPTFREKIERALVIKILQAKLAVGLGLCPMKLGLGVVNEKALDLQKNYILAEELHKEFRKPKHYLKVKVFSKDDIWSADLIDLPIENLGRLGRYSKALTVIDMYTRYAWVIPIKNKQGITIYNAFQQIFKESNRKPNKLFVDQGSEFYNSHMYKIFPYNKHNIGKKDSNGIYLNKIYSVFNKGKAVVIERFNRTLKNKLFKKFTEQGNKKWFKILPQIVEEYNNKTHTSIGLSPKQASLNPDKIRDKIYQNNYENEIQLKQNTPKLDIGDRVRIVKYKNKFEKGFTHRWSKEVFKISEVLKTNPIIYKIVDLDDEEIYGSFYQSELQKTEL